MLALLKLNKLYFCSYIHYKKRNYIINLIKITTQIAKMKINTALKEAYHVPSIFNNISYLQQIFSNRGCHDCTKSKVTLGNLKLLQKQMSEFIITSELSTAKSDSSTPLIRISNLQSNKPKKINKVNQGNCYQQKL